MRLTLDILREAKAAAPLLAAASPEAKNDMLRRIAARLRADQEDILAANRADVEAAREALGPVMVDRLTLTPARIAAMADGILDVTRLPDPVGRVLRRDERPNGLIVEKTSVPMGVIAMIYESRPNVTSDAAALALKAGSAMVLRGGKEAYQSNAAIARAIRRGIEEAGFPAALVGLVEDRSRQSARELMEAEGLVDLLIPRGNAGLIRACMENAKVPCIQTGTGICHLYADASADLDGALSIIENAKCSPLLPRLRERLVDAREKKGLPPVELRLDPRAAQIIPGTPAGENDFDTEFLNYILAVRVVDGVDEAIAHIARHSTGHSEAILARDAAAIDAFVKRVDSAAVYVNASTRFTDGGEFGLGCEMGISTQKLHARGPMGLEELTSYKYVVRGSGQIRG